MDVKLLGPVVVLMFSCSWVSNKSRKTNLVCPVMRCYLLVVRKRHCMLNK